MKQVSALQRLQSLPDIFRGADLTVRFGWTSKTASQYLYLWKQRKLVGELGGHSDIFTNLVTCRSPDWETVLPLAMPSSVIIGLEALRREGWITHIPTRPTVAVNTSEKVFKTDCFEVVKKPQLWFDQTRAARKNHDKRVLTWLPAAWALADLLKNGQWGEFGLWPDDIDWTLATPETHHAWEAACQAVKLKHVPLTSFFQATDD